jgi:hypothetical protein
MKNQPQPLLLLFLFATHSPVKFIEQQQENYIVNGLTAHGASQDIMTTRLKT